MRIKENIPNLLTLGNLFCGACAILVLSNGDISPYSQPVSILILFLAALMLDFLDGFVARLLKVTSPLGKQLDSLADMVTFGLLPGLLVFEMINSNSAFLESNSYKSPGSGFAFGGLIIPIFSAIRLAKFNVFDNQHSSFIGLATPANAIFWVALFLIFRFDGDYYNVHFNEYFGGYTEGFLGQPPFFLSWEIYLTHPTSLITLSVLFSFLLLAPIKLMAFKFKSFELASNWNKYIFLVISAILLILFFYRAVPLIIVLYFAFSFIGNIFIKDHEVHSNN